MLVLSHVWLLATPWTVTHQTPLSLGFCRQEYWTGLPFPPPEDLPNPGIKSTSPVSPALQEDSLPAEPIVKHLTQCTLGCFSRVWLFVTPWTAAHQTSLSMGFPRQEYWSRLPFASPEDLQHRDWTCISSCIGRHILYHWATWEAQYKYSSPNYSMGYTYTTQFLAVYLSWS